MTGYTAQSFELSMRRRVFCALLAVVPVIFAATLGNLATVPNIAPWYTGLMKPSFNPPNWIFAPVWTLLYAMIAYSFYRILCIPAAASGRMFAIALFILQIILNAAWSWAFFAAQSPLGGMIVIVLLWIVIINMLAEFIQLDRLAGWLIVPYLAWVTFAAILNFAIWRMN